MGRTKSQGTLILKRFGRGESNHQRGQKEPSEKEVGNKERDKAEARRSGFLEGWSDEQHWISQGQFRSPFQRILGGCIEVTLISSAPGRSLAAAATSPSPAYPAHGWFLIPMLSWGGSLLSQCPACSLKGSWEHPCSSRFSWVTAVIDAGTQELRHVPLPAHLCTTQHTPTSEQSPQLPWSTLSRAASYLRTSHQGMRSGSVLRVLRLWFSYTFSMDSQVLNTPGNVSGFPRWTRSRDLPLSLPHDIHISLISKKNLTAIASFVWPYDACLNEIMIMDRVIHGGYVCMQKKWARPHVCHRNLILGNFCQSIFISGPFLLTGF